MSQRPQRSLRLTPISSENLNSITGNSGELFYDSTNQTLRLYSGLLQGGLQLARADLANVTAATVATKVLASAALTWSNVTGKPQFSTVATTGSYTDLTNRPDQSLWKISADDSTVFTVPADESVSVRGQGMITTQISNDSTGLQLIVSASRDISADSLAFNSGVTVAEFSTDPTFADNSNSAVPVEQAIRTYIDRRLGFDANGDPVQPVNKIGPKYLTTGVLSGQVVSMHCERNGVGAVGQIMSFGNGSSTGKGMRMPAAGKLILATLAGANITGTITVQAYLNGSANASYQLSQNNGVAGDVGVTENFSAAPLAFAAGDTLGWYQAALPTTSNAFNVNFYVTFD